MNLFSRLPFSLNRSVRRTQTRKQGKRAILSVDLLEDRTVLSPTIYTVTSWGDSPSDPHTATTGDLRYCVGLANANISSPDGSLIQFDPTVFNVARTIALGGTSLSLNNTTAVTKITGPGASLLTVSGGGAWTNFSVFTINTGVTANISGLTIANGNTSGNGGGVWNMGNLTLSYATLAGNSANYGGGMLNSGTATLTNVNLSGNSATGTNSSGGGMQLGSGTPYNLAGVTTIAPNGSQTVGGQLPFIADSSGPHQVQGNQTTDPGLGILETGATANQGVGYKVAALGDMNGDGSNDFLVGAPSATSSGSIISPGTGNSQAFLLFGNRSATVPVVQSWLSATPEQRVGNINQLGNAVQQNPFTNRGQPFNYNFDGITFITSASPNSQLGAFVAAAGPNAFIIGAPSHTGGGRLYYITATSNFNSLATKTVDLDNPTNFPGLTIVTFEQTANPTSGLGSSFAYITNLFGDGVADIAIGEPGANTLGRTGNGAVYIIQMPSIPTNIGANNVVQVSANPAITFAGVASGDGAGFSVSSAGDVNGSTGPLTTPINDILIGAPSAGNNAGAAYLVYGGSTLISAMSSGVVDLGRLNVNPATGQLPAPPQGAVFLGGGTDRAGFSVSSAGDFNGDGLGDFMIGSPGANGSEGRINLFYGAATKTATINGFSVFNTGITSLVNGFNSYNLANIPTNLGFSSVAFFGASVGDRAGFALSSAGAIGSTNPILIGAPGWNGGQGSVYELIGTAGKTFTTNSTLSSTISRQYTLTFPTTFQSTTPINFGSGVSAFTTGGGDFVAGAAGYQGTLASANTALAGAAAVVIQSLQPANTLPALGGSSGGGLYNAGGTITLCNVTVSGNSAGNSGGGVYTGSSGTTTIVNCTVSGNSASEDGGGLYNASGTVILANTIVANSPSGGDIVGIVHGQNSLIDNASSAGGLTNGVNGNLVGVYPLLGTLGNYGGPTQTIPLLPGSPAINAGSIALAVDPQGNPLATDQRGVGYPRFIGGSVDIGAYELGGLTPTVTITDPGGTYNRSPFPATATVNGSATLENVGLTLDYQRLNDDGTTTDLLSLAPSNAGNYRVTAYFAGSADYNPASSSTTFSIAKRGLTVIATGFNKTYDGTTAATVALAGNSLDGDVLILNYTRAAFADKNVGNGKPVTAVGMSFSGQDAANYLLRNTSTSTTASINPAPVTITATSDSKTYDGTLSSSKLPTYQVAGLPVAGLPVGALFIGDSFAALTQAFLSKNVLGAGGSRLGVGYVLSDGNAGHNYKIILQGAIGTITPAPLIITANNASMVQGAAVPPLLASYSGFVNGDSPASLSTPPTLTTTATPVSPPGTYVILVGGASSPNYSINYANGILVVTPAPVKVLNISIQAIRMGKSKKTTQVIVVQFSGALDPGNAGSTNSYSLTTIPASKRQQSQSVALSQAQYNATTNTVTLITRKPLVLNPPIRLAMNAARLVDPDGNPLSGNCVATLSKRRVTF
jgi:hypothetical protein